MAAQTEKLRNVRHGVTEWEPVRGVADISLSTGAGNSSP